MARWISPLRVQSPCLLVDPLVLHEPLPIDAPPTAAVPLIPVMLVARLYAAPLPRCGTSYSRLKFTGESKVQWSSVIRFWTRHSCLAREVSILSRSPSLVFKLSRSPSKSPNSPRRAVTTNSVSGRPSAASSICGELFNSSQWICRGLNIEH